MLRFANYLLFTSIPALIFAVMSTGVTGQTLAVYLAIFCGFYGMIAFPVAVIIVLVVTFSRIIEKLKK